MKTYVHSALALLLLAAPLLAQTKQKGASVPPAVIPHRFEAKVVGVLDGDTIRVANAEVSVLTIRLDGIDAPESAQEHGKEATSYVHDLLQGKQVRVEWKERDKYQRLLGLVYFDGQLVNKSLVEKGHAWQFVKYNQIAALKELEEAARNQKLGLWTKDGPIAPWDWRDGKRPVQVAQRAPEAKPAAQTVKAPEPAKPKEVTVYLTETGTHYHTAGCRHLKKSSIPIPLSRASVYQPCKQCKPPAVE